MFYFATVWPFGLRTTNQFLRPSKCKNGSPNDRLEKIYQVHISLTARRRRRRRRGGGREGRRGGEGREEKKEEILP